MFEKLFGRGPKPEAPKSADSLGLGTSPEHVQNAFRAPNQSGVGFDKGSWGSQDAAGTTPAAPRPESPRAVLDQPMAGYVAAEETPSREWAQRAGERVDLSEGEDDEQMAAK